jgi:hypothetical protein
MITMEQALTSQVFHAPDARPCESKQGPIRWRRNGATKTWKRTPGKFKIPVKFGMYAYDYITNEEADQLHAAEDCPNENARY